MHLQHCQTPFWAWFACPLVFAHSCCNSHRIGMPQSRPRHSAGHALCSGWQSAQLRLNPLPLARCFRSPCAEPGKDWRCPGAAPRSWQAGAWPQTDLSYPLTSWIAHAYEVSPFLHAGSHQGEGAPVQAFCWCACSTQKCYVQRQRLFQEAQTVRPCEPMQFRRAWACPGFPL